MNRREWAREWIDTNERDDMTQEALVNLGVLAFRRAFPTLSNNTTTLMDIRHELNTACTDHDTYRSSGRQANERGETASMFGRGHDPEDELRAVKRLLAQKKYR